MDWVSLHYDNVRARVNACVTEGEAREIHNKMTIKWEVDQTNYSLIDQAKFLYATKIKGLQAEATKEEYVSID